MYIKASATLLILFLLLAGCAPASPTQRPAAPPTVAPNPTAEPTTAAPQATSASTSSSPAALTYPIVDSGQGKCYDNQAEVACPSEGQAFYGQDAQYSGNAPRYQDNGDGTISDLVSGLMWQQDPGAKMTYDQAVANTASFDLAGYSDWRLPSIKEVYSLILFDGTDASSCTGTCSATPFIDTNYFHFSYGDTSAGERVIDSQFVSGTRYVSTTMGGNQTVFGVNFADGRIKGYPTSKTFYVLYVRGNPDYGKNNFVDNGNGTISDSASGLTWMQSDSGASLNWEAALNYCESLDLAGASDWRLPNAKELQSIVDYSRSPVTTSSPAIDPIFNATAITNEAGQSDYPYYWSSTTHLDTANNGSTADYVSFGLALGYMNNAWIDVHGAGAQRSDPKTGDASQYPQGHGPQGDAIRVDNYVRCVRGGQVSLMPDGGSDVTRPTMTITSTGLDIQNGTSSGNGQQGNSQTPPEVAIAACSASAQGAACQFDERSTSNM